jgi:hypothetical protein
MNQLCLVTLASLVWVTAPAMAITAPLLSLGDTLQRDHRVTQGQQRDSSKILLSLEPSEKPIVQTEDWTTKDIKLPWNQVALDKSFGAEELVVFTKSFKFKLGFASNRKERVHARWTQKSVELAIMRGRDCGLLFGCESATSYGLPKRIKVTVDGQDFFLKTIEQNTYELTSEFKQAIEQTSGRLAFKVDERVNFEVQEEALPGLKQLLTRQGTANLVKPMGAPSTLAPTNPGAF